MNATSHGPRARDSLRSAAGISSCRKSKLAIPARIVAVDHQAVLEAGGSLKVGRKGAFIGNAAPPKQYPQLSV